MSGGPGRRAGSRNAASITLDRIMAADGEAVVRAVIGAARGGDMQAAKLVLDRIQPPRRGRAVPLDLPPVEGADDLPRALAALVAAMAGGAISPEEAHTVAAVFELHRRAAETGELSARIEALEKRLALGPPRRPEGGDEP